MSLSLYIARRLTLASDGHKSSPAIRVSITAVALSIAVMIASVAIVTGFKTEIREKVIGFNSHITLLISPVSEDETNVITLTPSLKEVLESHSFIKDYSLEVSIPAILKTSSDFKGIYLKSLNGGVTENFIRQNLEEGFIPDFSNKENDNVILISGIAARQLGLKCGEKIDTYFISDNVKVRKLEIAGIFNSHFDNYDDVMVYGSLGLIQGIAGLNEKQGTSLQIHTDNFDNIDHNASILRESLLGAYANGSLFRTYRVETARSQGAGYFQWLSLLDTNVAVVLTLMIIVAVATLISGMLILILDKKRFIGIVRALGGQVRLIRKVFIFLALRVALVGMIIGNVLILSLLYCQSRWHILPLDPESYYIDFVPVELDVWWLITLNIASLFVIYLCLLLPSRFVAGISPVVAMRNE